MKYFCLGDEDTVRGFRLAGVDGRVVTNRAEAVAALGEACGQPRVAILIITQEIALLVGQEIQSLRLECDRPLIVEIPGAKGPFVGEDRLAGLVRSAVGFHFDSGKVAS